MKRLALAFVPVLLVACGASGGTAPMPDLSNHAPDLSTTEEPDLRSPGEDLRAPPADLTAPALVDLASSDLTGAPPLDLTGVIVDLASTDLASASPPDLIGVPLDLKPLIDLAPAVDLKPLVDLAPPVDLATVPTTAWNAACTAASNCAAPTGETGICETGFGQPVCVHTCNQQDDYSLCEGTSGICVPIGGTTTKLCLPKCGDATNLTCAAGASCAFLGYRAVAGSNPQTFAHVGACLPDCTPTGPDACKGANTSCNVVERFCAPNGCPGGCPTNSTCVGATCTPNTPKNLYDACTPNSTNVATGCLSNTCFGAEPNPGFCSLFCNSETGDATCGTGGLCWTDNNRADVPGTVSGGTTSYPSGQFVITGGRTSGACVKACDDSSQCPAGFYCGEFNGKRGCIVGALTRGTSPPAGTGLPGALCRSNAACASGACFLLAGYLDGICQKTAAATCPAGTVAGNGNLCLKSCDSSADSACGDGSLTCSALNATDEACLPGVCRDSGDCATGYTCDSKSAECRMGPAGAKAVGTACAGDAECSGDFCIPQSTTVPLFSSGYCSAGCALLPDWSDTCPNGSICSAPSVGASGSCFKLCDAPGAPISKFGTCRTTEGYVCKPFAGDPRFGFCFSN